MTKPKLTVKSDMYGYACVAYYTGNTDNFSYKIRAEYGLDKLEWEVRTAQVIFPSLAFTDMRYFPEYAIIGQEVPIGVQIKNYNMLGAPCKGNKCAYNIEPIDGVTVTWKYRLNAGTPTYFAESVTDAKGRASTSYTVGLSPVMAGSDFLKFYAISAYTPSGLESAYIYSIPKDAVKIKMEKITATGAIASLPEAACWAPASSGSATWG